MTKKHFEAIARIIADQVTMADPQFRPILQLLAADIAAVMVQGNRHFDRTRFLSACGLQGP
jgi:hypothetical protein